MEASTIRLGDRLYPSSLGRLADAPHLLRLVGSLGTRPRVAVVGCRLADEYGLDLARSISAGLARAGVTIVSGGALGIDAAAHEAALEVGGHTVVVLGTGIDVVYPASHRSLFERIVE